MPLHQRIHRRTYPVRASHMGLGGLVVAASLAYQPANMVWWAFTAVSALAWPHIAYWHSCRQRDPVQSEYLNALVDSLIVGCWIALLHWSLLPSICIMAISLSDRSFLGLKERWLHFVIALLLGAGIMAALIQPSPQWLAPLGVQISLLPLVILHTAYTSHSTRRILKELARQNQQLKLLGRIDPLTTVYSRDYWWQKARTALRLQHTRNEQTCLLVIDIDHFKRINDEYGHIVGDEVLKLIGLSIRQCLRSNDIAGRYGGDEFTVLCKHAKAEDAYFVALRIRDKLAQIRVREHPQLRISASIGVAAADSSFESVADWINAADSALYSAKTAGRDQVIDATHPPANRPSNSPATIPMPEGKTALPAREQDAVV